jgi:hypothetical protein
MAFQARSRLQHENIPQWTEIAAAVIAASIKAYLTIISLARAQRYESLENRYGMRHRKPGLSQTLSRASGSLYHTTRNTIHSNLPKALCSSFFLPYAVLLKHHSNCSYYCFNCKSYDHSPIPRLQRCQDYEKSILNKDTATHFE